MGGVKSLVEGSVTASALRLDEPLSFWGGIDPSTGTIVERRHPQYGEEVSGRLLAMPHGRGSSSSSAILAEALRLGRGPAGIVLETADSILVVGALVGLELYGAICPIVVSDADIHTGETWSLSDGHLVLVEP